MKEKMSMKDSIRTSALQDQGSAKCTFEVVIRNTQNATWQGHLFWVDSNRRQSFRSVLEMLTLMDEALIETIGDSEQVNWK